MPEAPRAGTASATPGRVTLAPWKRAALSGGLVAAVFVLAANAHVLGQARGRITTLEAAPPRPLVIVLGSGIRHGKPAPDLAERLTTALSLYRSGRVQKIVVSGRRTGEYDEPGVMEAWLLPRGVPAADIVLDRGGYRTAASFADVRALGVGSVLIATQGYHLARSLYLARAAGIDALGVPARAVSDRTGGAALGQVREVLARAEIVLEVALRGVQP